MENKHIAFEAKMNAALDLLPEGSKMVLIQQNKSGRFDAMHVGCTLIDAVGMIEAARACYRTEVIQLSMESRKAQEADAAERAKNEQTIGDPKPANE